MNEQTINVLRLLAAGKRVYYGITSRTWRDPNYSRIDTSAVSTLTMLGYAKLANYHYTW